jgi:hypothetical protein
MGYLLGGDEWYVGTDGLGMMGASLGKGMRGAKAGIEAVLWCVNGISG